MYDYQLYGVATRVWTNACVHIVSVWEGIKNKITKIATASLFVR